MSAWVESGKTPYSHGGPRERAIRMSNLVESGKTPYSSLGLPKLIGSARAITAPARPARQGTGDHFWQCQGASADSPKASSSGFQQRSFQSDQRCSPAPSSQPERPGVQHVMRWIEMELEVLGLSGSGPSLDRVRVFSSALSEVIDMLPSYRPFLVSVQREYDALINRLQLELNAVAPLEGRLKTLKAEGLSFVGESMTWFQAEIASLRGRLADSEAKREALAEAKAQLERENVKLAEASERDRFQASESHTQNLDILKHLERMEKQVELLRRTEKEIQAANKLMENRLKERETRIVTVEDQLNTERTKNKSMVSRDEMESVKEDLKHAELRVQELEEMYAAKQKDYLSIVETYSKTIGQSSSGLDQVRPLTPRPTWHQGGILDCDSTRSFERAEVAQDLLQHMLTCSRTLLSAYGIDAASQQSKIAQRYAKYAQAVPLVGAEASEQLLRSKSSPSGVPSEEGRDAAPSPGDFSGSVRASFTLRASASSGGGRQKEDAWLAPDTDPETPAALQHITKVRNLRFSRKKAADFIDSIIHLRFRHGGSCLSGPFTAFMLEHLPEHLRESERTEFAVNVYTAVRRYSAEPDFLAYLLMLDGKISDSCVRDNKGLCAELLRIFTTHFETSDGSKYITKQKFFYGLREVLPNKEKDMWQSMVNHFPAGGPDVFVNYEWLLLDDLYILSPIIYALRLQHLEESLDLSERLEKTVRGCLAENAQGMLRFDALEAAFSEDPELASLVQLEDFAKAFNTSVASLKPETELPVDNVVELLKHGDIFHLLFFPSLPGDDFDLGVQRGAT